MSKRRLPGPAGMSGMVSLWGASSLIKSIQHGTVSIGAAYSGTATVSAVIPENCVLYDCGWTSDSSAYAYGFGASWVITNATTITATVDVNLTNRVYGFCLVEYMPGVFRSIQRASSSNANGLTGTNVTITEVNTAKSQLVMSGVRNTANAYRPDIEGMRAFFNSATQVQIRNGYTGGSATPVIFVLEYF